VCVFVNGENKRTIGRLKVDTLIDESVDKSDSELRSVDNTTSIGKTTHQDSVKNLACGAFCLWFLPAARFISLKNLACGEFSFFLIILWCTWLQVSYSVYLFIGIQNDSNSNTQ